MDNGDNFKRVLDLTEKSVEAWAKTFNKVEDLDKKLEWIASELKEMNKDLIKKPCITETIPYANFESFVRQQAEDRKDQISSLKDSIEEYIKKTEERIDKEKNMTFWLKLLAGFVTLIGIIIGVLVSI